MQPGLACSTGFKKAAAAALTSILHGTQAARKGPGYETPCQGHGCQNHGPLGQDKEALLPGSTAQAAVPHAAKVVVAPEVKRLIELSSALHRVYLQQEHLLTVKSPCWG